MYTLQNVTHECCKTAWLVKLWPHEPEDQRLSAPRCPLTTVCVSAGVGVGAGRSHDLVSQSSRIIQFEVQ